MNNIEIKSVRLRDESAPECGHKGALNTSVSHGPGRRASGVGIRNSKLEGECTCVARRPKNVPATSGLNELLTTTCDAHTCSTLIFERTLPCLTSIDPFLSHLNPEMTCNPAMYTNQVESHISRWFVIIEILVKWSRLHSQVHFCIEETFVFFSCVLKDL